MSGKAAALIIGIVLVLGAGAAGYVAGESAAPTRGEVTTERAEAFRVAAREAEQEAHQQGIERGHTNGRQDGRLVGRRVGADKGTRAGKREVAEREAAAAAEVQEQAAPDLPDYATTPSGGLICDGAIANDAHYQACLEQSGQ